MTGLITTKRTATNVSGKDQDLDVSTVAPAGAEIIVTDKAPKGPGKDGKPAPLPKSDKKIHLKKNGTTDIWITISAPEVANGQYFGRITLDPKQKDGNSVTIPVAFVKKQGIVTLTHECAPTTHRAEGRRRALHRKRCQLRQRGGEREPDGDEPRQGQGPRLHQHRGAGELDQEGRRRPVERHVDPGPAAAGHVDHEHHRDRTGRRLPAAWRGTLRYLGDRGSR